MVFLGIGQRQKCSLLLKPRRGQCLSSVSAAIVLSILSRRTQAERDREYPFGPFLAAGFLLALYVGAPIINAYLSLL